MNGQREEAKEKEQTHNLDERGEKVLNLPSPQVRGPLFEKPCTA